MNSTDRDDANGPQWGTIAIAVIAAIGYLLAVSRCGNQLVVRDAGVIDTVIAPAADNIKNIKR